MKKAGKIVSYLLVLVMVTSLFAGIGGKEQKASATVTPGVFTILELVPHADMGTVGYLVPDSAFENYMQPKLDEHNEVVTDEDGNIVYEEHPEVAYMTRGGNSKHVNLLAEGTAIRNFLVGGGYGTYTTTTNEAGETISYYSSNYFATNVLPSGVSANLKLITRTPNTLKQADIDAADMIIINETVPSALKVGSGVYTARFDDSAYSLSWEQAYAIFKKIAGVEGDPIPYLIDGSMGRPSTANWDDVRKYDITNPFVSSSNKTNSKFSAVKADQVDIMKDSCELGQELDGGSGNHWGSNAPSFKLFKLLSAINPATLYGLYFLDNDDTYGIDPITGEMIVTGVFENGLVQVYALGCKYPWWGDKYLLPYHLGNSVWDSYKYTNAISDMNWLDSSTWNYDSGFNYTIGKDKDGNKGNGIAYKNANSYFSLLSGTTVTTVINNFVTNTVSNDYHPYHYLVVTGHNGEDSVGTQINRSVIPLMVQYANSQGKGLVGGLTVECKSDLNYAGLSADCSPNYDHVFVVSSTTARTDLVGQFQSDLNAARFGLKFSLTPVEYYSGIHMEYREQNGAGYFPVGSSTVDGNKNFINDDDNPSKRRLEFNFEVTGGSSEESYTAKIYVDKNNDSVFAESESATLSPVTTGGSVYDDAADLNTLLEKDFVGGFAWKLVVTNGTTTVSKIGYSALRNVKNGKHSIKILQIYPTDFKSHWGSYHLEGGVYTCNPSLLIPTKAEVTAAGSITAAFPSVTNVMTQNGNSYKLSDSFLKHFDKIIQVRTSTCNLTSSLYETTGSDIGKYKGNATQVPNMEKLEYDSSLRSNILKNSALLQYYIENLNDFEIDCERYSVYDFNKAVYENKLAYYPLSKKIGKTTETLQQNSDGSQRYLYNPTDISVNTSDTVTWGGVSKKKYLADDATGLIYGERKATADEYEYYGSSKGTVNGTLAKEKEVYDLVVIGFGTDMDYMSTKAVDTIIDYIDKTKGNGNALIGNGAVTYSSNNTLGARLKGMIGMSDTHLRENGNYEIGEQNSMIINDTLFSHFPYKVPHYFKTTANLIQYYSLNLSSDLVVSFAKYASDKTYTYPMKNTYQWKDWGSAANNYYLYKKGNVTFCGFGQTFANDGQGQKGGVMSLAEDIMIVNALVTSSKFRADGFNGRAFFDCVDVDRSVLMSASLEDDERYNTNLANVQQKAQDAVYTDYNSFGLAASIETGFAFDQASSTDAMNSDSIAPTELGDKVDASNNIRWIPYQPTIADASYNLKIETTGGAPLSLTIYEYDKNSKKIKNDGNPISQNATTNDTQIEGAYKVKNNVYYIGVPLYRSGYPAGSAYDGLGFELGSDTGDSNSDTFDIVLKLYTKVDDSVRMVEEHTLTMVRRVIYPVD